MTETPLKITATSNVDGHVIPVRSSDAGAPADAPSIYVDAQTLYVELTQLYDKGLYVNALQAAAPLGHLSTWPGPEGRVLAGRLAGNLGAPRLGRALHWLAGREYPDHAASQYYTAMAYWSRFGTVHAWRRYRHTELPGEADTTTRADWLSLKAVMLGAMRDFARAEPLMIEALELAPDSPWLHVELSELLDRQDLHNDSLMAAREALKLRPYFRPAVQAAAHRLVQLRRDDEAMQLLLEAATRLQSGEVWCQLAALQRELRDYDAAWHSLEMAEKFWPLAPSDSQHHKWLAGERCDIACFLGKYTEAIELARKTERPFFQRIVERLTAAIEENKQLGHTSLPQSRLQIPVPFVRQFHETCVPATLTSIANYWQKPVKHEDIAERICYEGTRAYDERNWAEENGFHAREFRITADTVEQLIRAGVPMALTTVDPGSAHSQGIVGFDEHRGTLLIQDPNERHVGEAATDKFLEHYASTGPRGMLMVPTEQVARVSAISLPDAELYDDHYQADCALARHDRPSALAALQRMQQRDPEHRLTLQCELSLARYDSDPSNQLNLVDRLLLQFPTDANLLLMKIGLLGEFGQRSQRIEILQTVCSGDKTHPIFWSRLAAELLEDARDHDQAYYQLKRALRYNPSDNRAMALLAEYYWSREQREPALELYRLAAALNEKDESQSQRYFVAARYMNQTSEALTWLRDRHQRFADRNSSPGRTLAAALELIDQTPEALTVIDKTVAQHPEDGELLAHAALYFGRYNQHERAHELLQAAQGHCSEAVFLRSSALLAHYQGDIKRARELMLEVVRLDPLDITARERVLQADLDLEDIRVAESRLREAVERFPHSYSLRVMLIQFLRTHKLTEVNLELERFLQSHPHNAWARREAAITAIWSHDLTRASQEIQTAIDLEPRNDSSHCLQGRVLEQRGDIEGARAAYRRALSINIDSDSAITCLINTCDRPQERHAELKFVLEQLRQQTTYGDGVISYCEAATGRLEPSQLLSQLQEALSNRPDLWQVWSMLVHQHMAMNQRSLAIDVARQASERFPLVPRSWLDLALAHRRAADHDAELAALEKARSINPHWSEVARELCELYMGRQQFDEAERVIRQVLSADPRDAATLASLGECLYRADKKADSLTPLSAACASAPGYDWAWAKLCEWSRELDEGSTACATAEKAIDARPHDARCYRRMAETLSEIEEIPQALQFIEQSLALDNRLIDTHVLKAFYLGRLHQWDEALEACNPPVFAGDMPVLLRMRRAYILYRKGLVAEAIDEMQVALQRDPDHYGAWNQLADWSEELKRADVYRTAAENMVRLDPHQPAPRGYLADALLATDDGRPAAKQHLRIALELSPDYVFGTLRLFDLHIEDKEYAEARSVLELGAPHLPAGYEAGLQAQLLAAEDAVNATPSRAAIDFVLKWTQEDKPERSTLLRAMDHIESSVAQRLINELQTKLSSPSGNATPEMAVALGRLLVRTRSNEECMLTFNTIPDGENWHELARTFLRGMAYFSKDLPLLEKIRVKYAKRLKQQTISWSAMAGTLLDFGQNSLVVQWTRDWRGRPDLQTSHMLAVVASRWELYQLKQAQKATEYALNLAEDDSTSMLNIWAGLQAVLNRNYNQALVHARSVSMVQMTGWYTAGYRILVATLECIPGLLSDNPPPSTAEAKQMVHALQPGNFQLESAFAKDQLSKWILRQMAARVAEAHGLKLAAWQNRLIAFSYTLK